MKQFLMPSDEDFHIHTPTSGAVLASCSGKLADRIYSDPPGADAQIKIKRCMDMLFGCMLYQEPVLFPMLRALAASHKAKHYGPLKSFSKEFMPLAVSENIPDEMYDEHIEQVGPAIDHLIVKGMADDLMVKRLSMFIYGEEADTQAGGRFKVLRVLVNELYSGMHCAFGEESDQALHRLATDQSEQARTNLEAVIAKLVKECSAQASNPKILAAITDYKNEAAKLGISV